MKPGNKTYPWQHRRRKLLAGLALTIFLCCLPFVTLRWHGKSRVQRELAVIRAAGLPVSPQEAAQQLPVASPDCDGAADYEAAFAARKDVEGGKVYNEMGREQAESPGAALFSDAVRQMMRQYLEGNAERLRLLHEAAKHSVRRYPLDYSKGIGMELPHLAKLRDAVRLLQIEALVAAEDGDTERATQALLAAMAASDTVREEPVTISQLVRCACHGIVQDALRRVLSTAHLSENQLARLADVFRNTENTAMLSQMLAVERAQMLDVYDRPGDIVRFWGGIQELEEVVPGGTESLIRAGNALGVTESDKLRCLEVTGKLIEASRLPFHEMLPATGAIEDAMTADRPMIPRISTAVLGGLPRVFEAPVRSAAFMRSAYVALAVERYRLATDRLPPSLDDLVPLFLGELPKDPFDNKPLRYRLLDHGYIVYSVGRNLQDDAGAPVPPQADWRREGDLVFRVDR